MSAVDLVRVNSALLASLLNGQLTQNITLSFTHHHLVVLDMVFSPLLNTTHVRQDDRASLFHSMKSNGDQ